MLSVVIPVFNEAENIAPLVAEVAALKDRVPIAEIIYVNDGSTDATLETLKHLRQVQPMLRVINQQPRAGQSCALWTGVEAATQPLCVTLDGDGQNDPESIVAVFHLFMERAATTPRLMVAGERESRADNAWRRAASRAANTIRNALLRDGVRDTGCGLKMFRRDDYLALPYFNHMHRFLPALMLRAGVTLALAPVRHRARVRGASKYGVFGRACAGLVDLVGVRWLQARARPVALRIAEEP